MVKARYSKEDVGAWVLMAVGSLLLLLVYRTPIFFLDSEGYMTLSQASWFSAETWRAIRTLGYPLVLKMAAPFAKDFGAAPIIHTLILFLGLAVFRKGWIDVGVGKVRAAGAVAALLVGCALSYYLRPDGIETDAVAYYLELAVIGSFLSTLPRAATWRVWCAFSVFVFAMYQVRPAYLFMLAALPVLGFVCLAFVVTRSEYLKRRWNYLGRMVICLAVPLFLFCAFRYFVAGHFGLVSFGGTNSVGITGQLLTAEMVPGFSEPARTFASRLLVLREAPEANVPCGVDKWESPVYGRVGVTVSMVGQRFNCTSWKAAIPLAKEMSGGDWVEANRLMSSFSQQVLLANPVRYFVWLAKTFGRSVMMTLGSDTFVFFVGVFVLCFLTLVAWKVTGRTWPKQFVLSEAGLRFFWLSTVVAFSVFAFQTSITILVEFPIDRYIDPAAALLPLVSVSLAQLVMEPVLVTRTR